jgi:hypothetical protein
VTGVSLTLSLSSLSSCFTASTTLRQMSRRNRQAAACRRCRRTGSTRRGTDADRTGFLDLFQGSVGPLGRCGGESRHRHQRGDTGALQHVFPLVRAFHRRRRPSWPSRDPSCALYGSYLEPRVPTLIMSPRRSQRRVTEERSLARLR